jgi:hypothetical protein
MQTFTPILSEAELEHMQAYGRISWVPSGGTGHWLAS